MPVRTDFVPLGMLTAGASQPEPPPAFHVMVKPRGAICNLDCSYCFYLRKEAYFTDDSAFRMSDEVLESFTRQYIQAQKVPQVTFAWQGGEPTLMGLDFFRKAVELQKKYAPPDMLVQNSFQTNGVLVDEEWSRFFRENNFLIGLSMDGPEEIHNANRVDKGGKGSFPRVYRTLKLFQELGVEHNILCVVNRVNSARPREVYQFFRSEGVEFIQFIPAVEKLPDGGVSDWSVRPGPWGQFLCGVFDEWVRRDVGRVFVQQFDVALEAFSGMEPSLCVHAKTCGAAMALEHGGELFSCDHYVRPENYLGNITQTPMEDLAGSPFQKKFGQDKWDTLPDVCRKCDVLFACNGGCPKDRFLQAPGDGKPLHYLCEGYKTFFRHIRPHMETMAELLRRGQPPAMIMNMLEEDSRAQTVGRNDPCPCGSGRKHKHCCLSKTS